MLVYEAIEKIRSKIKDILISADLIDGSTLTNEQVRNEVTPLFWEEAITTKEASDKERFVVYSFESCDPSSYGDSNVMTRQASVIVNIVSRSRKMGVLIKEVNKAFINNGWSFELRNNFYDEANKMFVFVFVCGSVIE